MKPAARAIAGMVCVVLTLSLGYAGSLIVLGARADKHRAWVVLGEMGQGVVSGTDVKMRGVVVGQVGRTRLNDDLQAVVELVLDADRPVPERATFQVTGKTLLGEKQVEVFFDGPVEQGPFLAEGAVVTDPDRVVEFQDVLASLARLVAAIDPDDLAVVFDDFFGAFEGMGPEIARSVDEGARAAGVFAGSLDDQVANTRDLGLVVESLGGVGGDFNRLGRNVLDGMPTLSDNQAEIRGLLDELRRFSRTLNATFTVNRAALDRMMVEGDNITRMLFDYRFEVGELVSGLVSYTVKYDTGFQHPSVTGQAARFQIILSGEDLERAVCEALPPELAETLPPCDVEAAAAATPDVEVADPPPLALDVPHQLVRELLRPDEAARLELDSLLRRALPGGVGNG